MFPVLHKEREESPPPPQPRILQLLACSSTHGGDLWTTGIAHQTEKITWRFMMCPLVSPVLLTDWLVVSRLVTRKSVERILYCQVSNEQGSWQKSVQQRCRRRRHQSTLRNCCQTSSEETKWNFHAIHEKATRRRRHRDASAMKDDNDFSWWWCPTTMLMPLLMSIIRMNGWDFVSTRSYSGSHKQNNTMFATKCSPVIIQFHRPTYTGTWGWWGLT